MLHRKARPEAQPNAGFMSQLQQLEVHVFGCTSVLHAQDATLRSKPQARTCPCCGDIIGVSEQSLAVHMRKYHNNAQS